MIEFKSIISNKLLPKIMRRADVLLSNPNASVEKIFPKLGLQNASVELKDIKGQFAFKLFATRLMVKETLDDICEDINKLNPLRILSIPLMYAAGLYVLMNSHMDLQEFIADQKPKTRLVFSSDGEKGIWDIATMSMRGVSSCMSWGAQNSKYLLGSVIDPYCGIIYFTSEEDYPITSRTKYGPQMDHRALVRYIVSPNLGPALYLERIYSTQKTTDEKLQAIYMLFGSYLRKQTGLPVVSDLFNTRSVCDKSYIPLSEPSLKVEYPSYRDSSLKYLNLLENPASWKIPSEHIDLIKELYPQKFTQASV